MAGNAPDGCETPSLHALLGGGLRVDRVFCHGAERHPRAPETGVAAGRFDFAVAAITVTAEREKKVEFSQPYYHSGFGVAVQRSHLPSWQPLLDALTSFGLLQAILALTGMALLVGRAVRVAP